MSSKEQVYLFLKYNYSNNIEFAKKIAELIYGITLNEERFNSLIITEEIFKKEIFKHQIIKNNIMYLNSVKWRRTLNIRNPQQKDSVDFSQITYKSIN